jgi:hypothetical protein
MPHDLLRDADVGGGASNLCACTIHESGRGVSPCLGHATRLREHQAMYAALHAIAEGADDPNELASDALDSVRYWHEDHPLPALGDLRPIARPVTADERETA